MDCFAESSEDSRDSLNFSPNAIGVYTDGFPGFSTTKIIRNARSGNVTNASINE